MRVVGFILLSLFVCSGTTDDSFQDVEEEVILDMPEPMEIRRLEVVATMYQPVHWQTDSTPNILADGTVIEVTKAREYRVVALSRDLLSRWGGEFNYGDTVLVVGAGNYDGEWVVRDSMHKRWKRRIDFLCNVTTKPFKYVGVLISKKN